jgi:hypothetical protein
MAAVFSDFLIRLSSDRRFAVPDAAGTDLSLRNLGLGQKPLLQAKRVLVRFPSKTRREQRERQSQQ